MTRTFHVGTMVVFTISLLLWPNNAQPILGRSAVCAGIMMVTMIAPTVSRRTQANQRAADINLHEVSDNVLGTSEDEAADNTSAAADTHANSKGLFCLLPGTGLFFKSSLDHAKADAGGKVVAASQTSVVSIAHKFGVPDNFLAWDLPKDSKGTDKHIHTHTTVDSTTCNALGDMVDSFATSELAFISAITSLYTNGDSNNLFSVFADTVQNNSASYQKPMVDWTKNRQSSQFSNMTVQAGGGFGFGFQIYCGCQLIFSSGMGWGGGFLSTGEEVVGGQGGGGGGQFFKGEENQISLGGGGGSQLNESYGKQHDPDQNLGIYQTMEDLIAAVRYRVQKCSFWPSGKISVTAGGGGGFGFNATFKDDPSKHIQYGGGWGFGFTTRHFKKNTKNCGQINNDAKTFEEINNEIQACRDNKCSSESPEKIESCNCLCVRHTYQKAKKDWSKHICCPGDTNCTR